MKIIPVIDLKDGVVVHARQGMCQQYQPISTRLCQSPNIFQVIEAFLGVYDFDTIYLADLDAITHQGDHDRRLPDQETLKIEIAARQEKRNAIAHPMEWRFTNEDARIKLKKLYPTLHD